VAGGLGVLAFPVGLDQVLKSVSPGVQRLTALVKLARSRGIRGHELLQQLGTTGIQCPIKLENGTLVGTERIHEDSFETATGKAVFPIGDWNNVEPFQKEFAPQGDEL
jgi:hypothetical protein